MSYPQELMERKQWVNWRLIPDKEGGKDKKMPFNPISGKGAASNNPATWTDYATAADALERYGFTGLGFMFTKDDDLVGVDVDHCYDPATKTFNDTAKAIIAKQPTYMEFSPSGTGIHLFFKGTIPGTGNKNTKTGVEMYEHTRYFTMTGKRLDSATDTIAEDDGTLKWIHETYIRSSKKQKKKAKKNAAAPLTDDDLLELAKSAENGESFTKLWDGDWQGDYSSQSEADMALCCKLAFWSGKDKEQMDRLFRQSGLFREKWDTRHHASGATYGEETLAKACELTEDVYASGGNAPVYEYKGQYFRAKGDNTYPITNFVFVPVEMIIAEEETQLTADLVTVRGETYRLTFMTTDFANQQKFKNALNKRTIALSYTGSDGDLELLKAYVSELDWPTKIGVKAMGIYEHESGMAFVSSDGAVDADGAAVESIVQLEKYRSIASTILAAKPLTASQLQRLGERLMSYNEPAKTVSILAWISGCFIKEHLRKKNMKFPHLMLIGEAGSGKSNTLERVIMPVFSRAKIVAAGQTTAFTLMKDAASSNIIPMALDEFKPSKIDRFRLDALLNHFRNSYDGQEGIRGRADQSIVSYELLAPLVVAGEESPDEAAIRERSIELLFSKKDLKAVECRAAFRDLCSSDDLLGSLGHSLLSIALKTKPAECYAWYEDALGSFNKELPSRIVNNLACMVAGLRLLEKLCGALGLTWHEVFPYNMESCTRYIEYAAKEYLLDGGTSNKSVIEQTLEVMSRMGLDPKSDYAICDGDAVLALRLNPVYDKYTKYRKDYAVAGETLTYAQFKLQLSHSDYFLESNVQKRIGSENRRVWTLNYGLLKARCDVSGFELTEIEPL
ncbi:DNA primase [Desulfitobacterium sp.]|uniref:phage NrS-1 polymerase family protein n=1 Tax=Desulfitobacterium sp. TaxID=49981 RepID=UPI002B21F624|nr:DNA primase [Desulfitobacterium sp.]MEA4900569.1 DNA primase [Desulfitobacterium sp.]